MRYSFHIALVLLVMLVTGCGGAYRYDSRLAAADSLMHDLPDSALALIQAVNPASLTREGDRAYHDLLLTQARYRCYITATSDSDINRALNYYRRHDGEREKLTRAYIYKGAVMEELGHPDSAMLYYKHAEATAAPTDYFNLGYAKLRMGALYSNFYDMDGQNILKYEDALKYFTLINDRAYIYTCLNNLGCLYRESHPQKAEQMLLTAMSISKQSKDTAHLVEDYHSIIALYYYKKKNDKALKLVREVTELNYPNLGFEYCTTAANVYAKAGLIDSASLYLKRASKYNYNQNAELQMYYLESLCEIALAKRDSLSYYALKQQWKHISDSLVSNPQKLIIIESESAITRLIDDSLLKKVLTAKRLIALLLLATIIITVAIFFLYRSRMNRNYRIIYDLKKEASGQLSVLNTLQHNISQMRIKDQQTKVFIDSQLMLLQEITEACYNEQSSKLGKQLKRIFQFEKENEQKWYQFYNYIDSRYSNIISETRKNYPQLNDKDLLLIALNCLGFSYIQIAIIMGYTNATSIGTMKNRLALKMQLRHSLNDYIRSFKAVN